MASSSSASDQPADSTEDTGTNPAVVAPQQYAAGVGWDVGQAAPQDAYRALDAAGTGAPVGPVVHTHPGGYARQIVAKGGLITDGVRRELDAADSSESTGA